MENQPKQTIQLSTSVAQLVASYVKEFKELKSKLDLINDKLSTVLATVCLSNDIDLNINSINLNDSGTEILVFDLPKEENETEKPKTKKATMKT